MTEWQPIATAPKDGTWFVGLPNARHSFAGEAYPPAVMRVTGQAQSWQDDNVKTPDFLVDTKAMNAGTSGLWKLSDFTHWMMLPRRTRDTP